jgi:hypothetical protein
VGEDWHASINKAKITGKESIFLRVMLHSCFTVGSVKIGVLYRSMMQFLCSSMEVWLDYVPF